MLFSGLSWILRLALMPKYVAVAIAAAASALLFAAAHHIGPYGEKMNTYVFLFRTMAGLYFATLYQFRGFAVAAGTHACYDVLVGLTVGADYYVPKPFNANDIAALVRRHLAAAAEKADG